MRVLVVRPGPLYSVADVHNGLVKALRQHGCDVIDFKYDDLVEFHNRACMKTEKGRYKPCFDGEGAFHMAARHLLACAYETWPDVIIVTSGFWVPPSALDVLAARGHHLNAWLTESPYEDDHQINIAARVHSVVLNDPTHLQTFQQVNPRSYYFPHSYDPAFHYPQHGARPIDCSFVGTGFRSRVELLEKVNWDGIDFRLAGMWAYNDEDSPLNRFLPDGGRVNCLHNDVTAALYRLSKTSFNLYRKETSKGGTADGWSMGPREVELAACQTWFARESRPEGDQLFPMLPTFSEPGELEEQIRWALANPAKAQVAAAQAYEAIADRTFYTTVANFLSLVDK